MDDTRRRLAAIVFALEGGAPQDELLAEAAYIDEFLQTGEVPPRRLAVRLSRGGEVARPNQQGSGAMASEVHRGKRLEIPASLSDAVTGAGEGWDRVAATTDVQPPEAGVAVLDTARSMVTFDPALDGTGQVNCVVALTVTPNDGGPPVTAVEAVVVDPDGVVISLSSGTEVDRPAASAGGA